MRSTMRMFALLFLAGAVVAQAGEPFEVVVGGYGEELPLGVLFRMSVEVRNVTAQSVTVAFGEPPLSLEVVDDAGRHLRQCDELVELSNRMAKIVVIPASWRVRRELLMCVDAPGRYRARTVMRSSWANPVEDKGGRHPWDGQVTSRWVDFHVVEPKGVDRKAYLAFDGNPVPIVDRNGTLGELLRRFPASTYAAYVVWNRWGRVTAGAWKSTEDRDKFFGWLAEDPDQEYLTWKLPCAEEGGPDATLLRRLGGRRAIACRDQWLQIALDHHSRIWFADEIRLRLALDKYRLGDKDACAAGLADLAEHGKPYVASKAGELLSAMRAKGMLPEKGK